MTDNEAPTERCGDACGICARIFLLAFGIFGFCLCASAVNSCAFLVYQQDSDVFGDADSPPKWPELGSDGVEFGLHRYYSEEFDECRKMKADFPDLGTLLSVARAGNILAIFVSLTAIILILFEIFCCRFPCARLMTASLFVVAGFCQALTFLVYLSELCTYNISSTPYSCESLGGTWVALVAVLILFITSVISCWAPKPVPLVWRARRFFDVQDEADPCCGAFCCFGEKAKDDEVTDGAIETGTEKSIEKKNKEKIPLQNNDKSAAGVTANINAEGDQDAQVMARVTFLEAVRLRKHGEIEKQLDILAKYKDSLPRKEYEEMVSKLLRSLPDPWTYDAYTNAVVLSGLEDDGGVIVDSVENAEKKRNKWSLRPKKKNGDVETDVQEGLTKDIKNEENTPITDGVDKERVTARSLATGESDGDVFLQEPGSDAVDNKMEKVEADVEAGADEGIKSHGASGECDSGRKEDGTSALLASI